MAQGATPAEAFVDTNVWVYAFDAREAVKQRRAIEVLSVLGQLGSGVVSTQVLTEFFDVASRKLDPPLPVSEARLVLETVMRMWHVVPVTTDVLLDAASTSASHGLRIYDASIMSAARHAGARVVLSEDLSEGQVIDGVIVRNPFADDFDVRIPAGGAG